MRSAWNGMLEIVPGLGAGVPIKLMVAAKRRDHEFSRMRRDDEGNLYKVGGTSWKATPDDPGVLKGWEVSAGQYVEIDKAALADVQEVNDKTLRVVKWVPKTDLEEIVYEEKTYYLMPDKGGEHNYRVFAEGIRKQQTKKGGLVPIGRFVLQVKEYCFILSVTSSGVIMLRTFHYPEDVNETGEIESKLGSATAPLANEVKLLTEVVERFASGTFNPDEFRCEARARIQDLIDRTVSHEAPQLVAASEAPVPVTDVGQVLQEMLQSGPRTKQVA